MFFPSLFDNATDMMNRANRKKRILAMCDLILSKGSKEAEKKLLEVEMAMLQMIRPKNFIGAESYEIQYEKNYQTVCHGLNSHTNKDVKNMTILEVYSLMEMLQKQEKQNGNRTDKIQ